MMKLSNVAAPLLVAAAISVAVPAFAQAPAPDNTKSNKTNPANLGTTADDQKNDKSDLTLTRAIRKSVMNDKALSTYAHNVKIIAVGGNVTLSGVVRSQLEKDTVEAKAKAVVQQGSLTNNLTIAP